MNPKTSTLGTPLLLSVGAAILVATEFVVIGLAPAMSVDLHMTPVEIGWLVILFAVASASIGPFLVVYTMHLPPSVVLGCALLPFAANLLLAWFPSFTLAVWLRVFQGATLPVYVSIASTHLAQIYGTGRGVAMLYIGVTIGGTFAVPLGTFISDWFGWRAPVVALGFMAAITALFNFALRIPPLPERKNNIWAILLRPYFACHLLLSILLFATMFCGYSYIATLLTRADLAAAEVSLALLIFGAASVAGNWLAGKVTSHVLVASVGVAVFIAAGAVGLVALANPSWILLIVILFFWGGAHAAGFVLCQVRVMAVSPNNLSFAGSINIAAANIGIATGTFFGGYAITIFGLEALAPVTVIFAILASGLAFLLSRNPC